jgi:hypothetical protein
MENITQNEEAEDLTVREIFFPLLSRHPVSSSFSKFSQQPPSEGPFDAAIVGILSFASRRPLAPATNITLALPWPLSLSLTFDFIITKIHVQGNPTSYFLPDFVCSRLLLILCPLYS